MAKRIGFTLTDGTVVVPDKNLRLSSKPRVLTAKFGDGYEQRIADGINTNEQSFSISFNNRLDTEIDKIAEFFEQKNAVVSFVYGYPDTRATEGIEEIKVVCTNFDVTFIASGYSSCSATLKRVYEA